MSSHPFRREGLVRALSLAEAFPITAYFGALRIDFESADAARRWLGDQLAQVPEQDRFGWFTKEEAPDDLGEWDSLHLLHPRTAERCRRCHTDRAHVEHMTHGPLCCPCSDDLGREEAGHGSRGRSPSNDHGSRGRSPSNAQQPPTLSNEQTTNKPTR